MQRLKEEEEEARCVSLLGTTFRIMLPDSSDPVLSEIERRTKLLPTASDPKQGLVRPDEDKPTLDTSLLASSSSSSSPSAPSDEPAASELSIALKTGLLAVVALSQLVLLYVLSFDPMAPAVGGGAGMMGGAEAGGAPLDLW